MRYAYTFLHDVDVVLDLIGGEILQRSWGVLKAGGMLVSLLEPPSQVTAAKYNVRATIMGAQPTNGLLQEFAALIDSGKLKTHIGKVFPLEQARQAQELKRHPRSHSNELPKCECLLALPLR